MKSSGIKRGLAITATSALAVAGLGVLASPANAAGTDFVAGAYSISIVQTNATDKLGPGQDADFKVVVTKTGGAAILGGDITLTFAATPKTGSTAPEVDVTGTGNTDFDGATDLNGAGANTVTLTDTDAKSGYLFSVSDDIASTLKVAAAVDTDGGGSGTTFAQSTATVVFDGGTTDPNNVAAIALNTTSISGYTTDSSKFTVTATDAAGYPVYLPAADYIYKYGTTTPAAGTNVTAVDNVATINNTSITGKTSVSVWIDQTKNATFTTLGLDAGEPNATLAVDLEGTPTAQTFSAAAITAVETGDDSTASVVTLPADEKAGSFTLSATLAVTGITLKGAKVAADVTLADSGVIRVTGTAAADGTVSFTVPFSEEDAVDLATVTAKFFVSGQELPTIGYPVGGSASAVSAKFEARKLTLSAPTGFQAASKGAVSVPVTVADQFGKGFAGTYSYSIASTTGNTTGAKSFTTNAAGAATISYTDAGPGGNDPTATSVGDTDTITYVDSTPVGPYRATIANTTVVTYVKTVTPGDVTWGVDASSGAANTSADSAALVSGTPFATAFTVHVTDGDATTPTNLVGIPVTIAVSGGGFATKASTDTVAKAVTSVTTAAGGIATFYVGSTKPGAVTVTATAGSKSVTSSKTLYYRVFNPTTDTLTGANSGYNVAISSASVNLKGVEDSAVLTATATDAWGNPIAGVKINGAVNKGGEILTGLPGTTGTSGVVTFKVEALTTDDGELEFTIDPTTKAPVQASATVANTTDVKIPVTIGAPAAGATVGATSSPSNRKDQFTVTFTDPTLAGKTIVIGLRKANGQAYQLKTNNGKGHNFTVKIPSTLPFTYTFTVDDYAPTKSNTYLVKILGGSTIVNAIVNP